MALAERWLAEHFNRDNATLFDHDVYALCSDGDMMEGVASEAASLAGHLKLSNLCWIYDNNHITIEGGTPLAFSESVAERFRGYGWNVLHVTDANDLDAVASALDTFRETHDAPTLIIVDSVIGWGSPVAGTAKAHSDPMGAEAIRETKRNYGWPEDSQFLVPPGVDGSFPRQPRRSIGAAPRGLGTDSGPLSSRTSRARRYARSSARRQACPTAGPATFRTSRRMPREWRRAMPAARC